MVRLFIKKDQYMILFLFNNATFDEILIGQKCTRHNSNSDYHIIIKDLHEIE